MPNWVYNTISFDGKNEDVKKLLDFIKGETLFDFNKIISMPEELNIERSSVSDLSFKIEEYKETKNMKGLKEILSKCNCDNNESINDKLKWLKEENMYNEELGKKAYNNYKKYGCSDWYEWRCRNWNTKWNSCDDVMDASDTISFSTAWDIPYPIFLKLSEMFPTVTIENSATFEMNEDIQVNVYLNGKELDSSDYSEEYKNIKE